MKKIFFLLILILSIIPASAWTINNSQWQYNLTNVTVTFPTNQSYDTLGYGANYIFLNNSNLYLIPTSPTVIYINLFQTQLESYNLTANGTGSLSITQNVTMASISYRFFQDGVYIGSSVSNPFISQSFILTGTNTTITYIIGSAVISARNLFDDFFRGVNTIYLMIGLLVIVWIGVIAISLVLSMLGKEPIDFSIILWISVGIGIIILFLSIILFITNAVDLAR